MLGGEEEAAGLLKVLPSDLVQVKSVVPSEGSGIPQDVAELFVDLVAERSVADLVPLALFVLGDELTDLAGQTEQRHDVVVAGENVGFTGSLLIVADVHLRSRSRSGWWCCQ